MCQRFAHKYAEERVLNVFDVRIQVGVLWLQQIVGLTPDCMHIFDAAKSS